MSTIQVLDKGFVRLDGVFADDLSVVNSARVSFNTRREEMDTRDEGLIGFLMRERHGTPFEHNYFRFHVKAPLFVFREWHRHRVGISINEWSARYSELQPDFYIPSNVRSQVGKPGSYTFEPISNTASVVFRGNLEEASQEAFRRYKKAIASGISKEQARFFLPLNIYSEMYWSCNARSLMSFLSLRNSEQAMWEIRQYAQALEDFFKIHMPITAARFVENGRKAP